MVKHIVAWKVADKTNLAEMKEKLMGMKGQVESLKEIEVGINYNESDAAYDVVLITQHNDAAAVEAYQADPVHHGVAGFIKERVSARIVVDFVVD